ncbi:MAG: A24 family peptidase, partial [Methanosphaera sp.]|nr:A24 family peptidase [Methanosphaera sp.]
MISSIKIIAFTVLIVGVVIASISDYKTLTISNKLTFFMFSSGLILGTAHYLTNDIKNLLPYYLSILLVFIFVYILWHIGLWAGGDVKLFTAISTLLCADYLDILPRYTFYGYVFPFFGGMTFIPTLSLITNSVLSIVPIIIIVIIYEIIKNKTYLIKDIVKRYDLINIASTLNAFGIIFLINDIIHIDNFMANIVFLLFISYTVNEISKKVEYTVIPLTLIILVMNVQYNNLQIYLLETAILLTVVLIKNIIKYNLLKETLSYDVKISELTESMILSYD